MSRGERLLDFLPNTRAHTPAKNFLVPDPEQSSLFGEVPLPAPSFRTASGKTSDLINGLDQFFAQVAAAYPPAIRATLMNIYRAVIADPRPSERSAGPNIGIKVEKLKKMHAQLEEELGYQPGPQGPEPYHLSFLKIDSETAQHPLILRISLIHELGAHLGQRLSRIDQVGVEEYSTGLMPMHLFTELTAAALEKEIFDGLPTGAFTRGLAPGDATYAAAKPHDKITTRMKGESFKDNVFRKGRMFIGAGVIPNAPEPKLTDAQGRAFLDRWQNVGGPAGSPANPAAASGRYAFDREY